MLLLLGRNKFSLFQLLQE